MVKLAIIVPTFGNPIPKLNRCLYHIRMSTSVPVIVHDDATPNENEVAEQRRMCTYYGVEYGRRDSWGYMAENYHDGCVKAWNLWDPDVFVIIQDDFFITPRWFKCLEYFWEKNWSLSVGSAGFRFAEAWELVSSGIIERDSQFWEVDWVENEVFGSDIKWNLEVVREGIESGRIQTKSYPPNDTFEKLAQVECPPDRFPLNGCRGLHGTTNAHMSVRVEVFFKVGGMKGLPLYIFDLEFGWKIWEAGFWNIEIPGPIGLHYAGASSKCAASIGLLNNEEPEFAPHMWPRKEAKEAFKVRWGSDDQLVVERKFLEEYVFPFDKSGVELDYLAIEKDKV